MTYEPTDPRLYRAGIDPNAPGGLKHAKDFYEKLAHLHQITGSYRLAADALREANRHRKKLLQVEELRACQEHFLKTSAPHVDLRIDWKPEEHTHD